MTRERTVGRECSAARGVYGDDCRGDFGGF